MIRIEKYGKVFYEKWVYDHEKGEGHYEDEDISHPVEWMHKRDLQAKLAPGVTLNDLFMLVAQEPEICDIILTNCFIKDYAEVWKGSKLNLDPVKYDPDGIEYLELYWYPELFEFEGVTELTGANRVNCHGIGFELKEDKLDKEDGYVVCKKGDRINWGIDFCKLSDILHLEIKLDTTFIIYDDWEKHKGVPWKDLPRLVDCHKYFTLIDILEGVFWELSFYGSEKEKHDKLEELDATVTELKEAEANGTLDQITKPISFLRDDLNDGYINDGAGWESQ